MCSINLHYNHLTRKRVLIITNTRTVQVEEQKVIFCYELTEYRKQNERKTFTNKNMKNVLVVAANTWCCLYVYMVDNILGR